MNPPSYSTVQGLGQKVVGVAVRWKCSSLLHRTEHICLERFTSVLLFQKSTKAQLNIFEVNDIRSCNVASNNVLIDGNDDTFYRNSYYILQNSLKSCSTVSLILIVLFNSCE